MWYPQAVVVQPNSGLRPYKTLVGPWSAKVGGHTTILLRLDFRFAVTVKTRVVVHDFIMVQPEITPVFTEKRRLYDLLSFSIFSCLFMGKRKVGEGLLGEKCNPALLQLVWAG